MITERDIAILLALVRYYVLNRAQIQRLCFPTDAQGRVTRRRLQTLVEAKLVNRARMEVVNPAAGAPAPVYFPARKACEFLAEFTGDERHLLTPTQTPQSHHLFHWLAVSETHMTIDAAIERQSDVALADWINEWDVVNKDESSPDKRYRLYTLIHEQPKLVCAPDAAFLLAARGHAKVYYLEQDRNTSGVHQIAASKTAGYAAMAERGLHRRHFPQTTLDSFGVLMIAPTPWRRDALRKALRGKPGATLWRFASATEVTPESFLSGLVFHPCEGEAAPLVKPALVGGPV